MHLIVIHKNNSPSGKGSGLLRFALASEPIAEIIFDRLTTTHVSDRCIDTTIAVPQQWPAQSLCHQPKIMYYNGNLTGYLNATGKGKTDRWLIISNGRFVTSADRKWLNRILTNFDDDLVAVNVDSELLSYRERVRIASGGNIAGFRRLYSNSALPCPLPTDWPHHVFVKLSVLDKILVNGALPLVFADFVTRYISNSLNWHCFRIGGSVLDLETEAGLLNLLTTKLHSIHRHPRLINGRGYCCTNHLNNCSISANARIFGKVMVGNNVQIGNNATIVGPVILGDNVRIPAGTTIRASVIGHDLSLPKNYFVQNRILLQPELKRKLSPGQINIDIGKHGNAKPFVIEAEPTNSFRTWSGFSYARCTKRIFDITATLIVLILFAPVLPIIAVAIKLSSQGPVFFRHKREGLHGKEFYCLKFRTMVVGANKIQRKLRFKNQVDGPQFKVRDDPRVTVVGRFLRDTFIDEIPQFINVLLGQMSIVGPRPSPKMENLLCPFWRDARLSVRPGITGLWQVRRTRRPGRDFQEWIYYDTKYVKDLSLRLDLSICWQTAKKLTKNFIKQF